VRFGPDDKSLHGVELRWPVDLETEPLDDENKAFINFPVVKAALLALALNWDATWCSAYPSDVMQFWPKPGRGQPMFRLAWISYLSPRFAPMVTPPPSAIVERTEAGGLVMSATAERFETANPAHLAAARDIFAALAPVNALPWPPDAEPA
jgi:hypothetical protein